MAKLSGMSGDFKGREYPIEQGEITIGRKTDNVILLDHPTISSHHCRILRNGDACVLQDLDSTNGTWHDGSRVATPVPVRVGAPIKVGATTFELRK